MCGHHEDCGCAARAVQNRTPYQSLEEEPCLIDFRQAQIQAYPSLKNYYEQENQAPNDPRRQT